MNNSDNVILFPATPDSRLKVLNADALLAEEAVDALMASYLLPLLKQCQRVSDTIKSHQTIVNQEKQLENTGSAELSGLTEAPK